MAATIDYFYTHISPWAYLGHQALMQVAVKHQATVRFRPFAIMEVWNNSGGVPLPKRDPARQRYRMMELQRWRDFRNVELTLEPAHFPTNPSLADRCAIALGQAGKDPSPFTLAAFKACWLQDQDIADSAIISAILKSLGHEPEPIIDASSGDAVSSELASNTNSAIETDCIGSPAYVLNGEAFWGQDRIEILDAALASERGPYRP